MFTKSEKNIEELGIVIPPARVLTNGRMLVTDEQRRTMKILYEKGFSTWKIGKAFGYLNVCVINNLKKMDVKLRNHSDANKVFKVNRHYFDVMDTHEKAYILGLIYSDGNLSKDSFTLALQEGDEYLLEAIKKELNFTGPINIRKPQKIGYKRMFALRIHDKTFCNSLRKLNIFERKTTRISFPYFLHKKFYFSFLHGLLDGDGWISWQKGKQIKVGIAGSPIIIPQISDFIQKETGIKMHVSNQSGNNGWKCVCNGTSGLIFLDRVFSDKKKFCLTRKHGKFLKALNYYIARAAIPKFRMRKKLPILNKIAQRHFV